MKYNDILKPMFILLLVVLMLPQMGCDNSVSNDNSRVIERDFQQVYKKYKDQNKTLFSVFQKKMTEKEKFYLKFLYAYMPLNDMADYPGEFFLNNVRLAMAARDSFSWGSSISEDVFLHFVLPYRVNNENLDTARIVFFKELYPRIKDLPIEQAALEVNHWCHEKVNYQPTDSRTISPLGAIKTAYGRCGEESTFAVTAMRSVGIPARQVYTPRWAHVDDNHAWVEVWVNGRWQYLGACEPEPVLNMGWFDAPVLRAMMVYTKAFGKYMGEENVIDSQNKYATLNSLHNYAPTKDIWVKIQGEEETHIEFGLYNYAEFFPIKSQDIKAGAFAHIKTGLGDIRVFASNKSGHFAIKKINVSDVDTVFIELDKRVGNEFNMSFENVPPVEKKPVSVDAVGTQANKKRLSEEDQIRNDFISSFYDRERLKVLAKEIGLNADTLWPYMKEARGNYSEIELFLKKGVQVNKQNLIPLLQVIAKKDLHDVSADVLLDHLKWFKIFNGIECDHRLVNKYILNPRIYLEGLSPYRAFLQKAFDQITKDDVSKAVKEVVVWINGHIMVDESSNYYRVNISPQGVFNMKTCDSFSRKLFFIATLRSLGIPARLEPATHEAQYFNNKWINISFDQSYKNDQPEMAKVKFAADADYDIEPLYRVHFSIAKFKDGRFQTLHYDWEKPLSSFPEEIEIEAGYYQLLTGNRMEDGSVLVNQQFVNIEPGSQQELKIKINEDRKALKEIARCKSFNLNDSLSVLGWIDPGSEPGNHFFNDFKSLRDTYESAKVPFTFFCTDKSMKAEIVENTYEGCIVKEDSDLIVLKAFYEQTKLSREIQLPVFVVVDNNGEVYYHSSGYNIGTSEQLLKIYKRLLLQ